MGSPSLVPGLFFLQGALTKAGALPTCWLPAFAGMTIYLREAHLDNKKARQIDGLTIFVPLGGRDLWTLLDSNQ
ncbi:MAG: hypothetical protein RLZZ273_482 [Bacteroidota bacterium]